MTDDPLAEQYRRDGYVLLERVLTDNQLADVRQTTNEIVAGARRLTRSDDTLDLHSAHTPEHPRVRRIKNVHQLHQVFHDLVRSENLLAPLKRLIGDNIRLHGSKLNLKGAGGGDAIEWHQDWAFYPHSNEDVLAIGIFLDDVDAENAPVLFLPGSHRGPVHDHHSNGAFVGGVDVTTQHVDVSSSVAITGAAGSMSIHHARLLHGSAINRSSRQRRILFYELAAADAWPLMGKGHIGDGRAASYDGWFNGMMVCGSPTTNWRMTSAPFRVPFPEAYAGATSSDGTIYRAQEFLPHRYFADRSQSPTEAAP